MAKINKYWGMVALGAATAAVAGAVAAAFAKRHALEEAADLEDDFEDEQEDDEQPEAKDCFRLYDFQISERGLTELLRREYQRAFTASTSIAMRASTAMGSPSLSLTISGLMSSSFTKRC